MLINVSADIVIRVFRPEDDVKLFRLVDTNRQHLMTWLPWLDQVNTLQDSQTFIETAIYRYNALESASFAILFQHKLVGVAGFNLLDYPNRLAAVGYWLDKAHIGQGIITQVVSTLLDYGFCDQKFNKIEIRCAEHNIKSRAVAERLGFTYEGKLRQCEWLYDRYVDHLVYSKLASEY